MTSRTRFALLAALLPIACQNGAHMAPAELVNTDAENVAALKAALAEAVGRAQIEITPEDLSGISRISVLPPPPGPLETHSLALPVSFTLMADETGCVLVQAETGDIFPAPDVSCQPVTD